MLNQSQSDDEGTKDRIVELEGRTKSMTVDSRSPTIKGAQSQTQNGTDSAPSSGQSPKALHVQAQPDRLASTQGKQGNMQPSLNSSSSRPPLVKEPLVVQQMPIQGKLENQRQPQLQQGKLTSSQNIVQQGQQNDSHHQQMNRPQNPAGQRHNFRLQRPQTRDARQQRDHASQQNHQAASPSPTNFHDHSQPRSQTSNRNQHNGSLNQLRQGQQFQQGRPFRSQMTANTTHAVPDHMPQSPMSPQNRQVSNQAHIRAQSAAQINDQPELPPFECPSDAQVEFLRQLASVEIPKAEMTLEELDEKEELRLKLQEVCRDAVFNYEVVKNRNFKRNSVALKCFGSLSSGFATKASDMDLALVSPYSRPEMSSTQSEIPRVLEKALLDSGYGARLLTKTRVPIIKFCEKPTPELSEALLKERTKYEDEQETQRLQALGKSEAIEIQTSEQTSNGIPSDNGGNGGLETSNQTSRTDEELVSLYRLAIKEGWYDADERKIIYEFIRAVENYDFANSALDNARAKLGSLSDVLSKYRPPPEKHLDFPKAGVGIQCDINFSNPLALHNTRLLRCYALCDPRVRQLVLFVKAWAKRRKINSPYHGTLSSYGYVLMVLHYLANVVDPPVVPNLQTSQRALLDDSPENSILVDGYNVRFWRSEREIRELAHRGVLTRNTQDGIGILICGFFHYYAYQDKFSPAGGFCWGREVISLRTPGGLLRKAMKDWCGAKILIEPAGPGREAREIKHRYLVAIEDPFEIDHNIGRTVVHSGIVSIRDEFRRAIRIIQSAGQEGTEVEYLFKEAKEPIPPPRRAFGPLPTPDNPGLADGKNSSPAMNKPAKYIMTSGNDRERNFTSNTESRSVSSADLTNSGLASRRNASRYFKRRVPSNRNGQNLSKTSSNPSLSRPSSGTFSDRNFQSQAS